MCNKKQENCCNHQPTKNIKKLKKITKALHCQTRWKIIKIIGTDTATTSQIKKQLQKTQKITQPTLYYHLSELKNANIIKVNNYKEKGQGAPEKNWKLKTQKIEINLIPNKNTTNK
ncbi:winged helix-turn-helix domain-containing protein [Methanonatronarchaeum sp. AMET-Sl]|uniref:winged helix-turn-helix domain-containing protein n=1 Tax=Methanonatronarchaeum sp. AMET-Sl TaxID=3037654 RepID=UPI00244E4672|nr:winged helix-turn-helix domain-containing protein [Methanonatronarchaeum sp. AMET-Sl]WGI18118.1 winged helix-turn-helix domain-containing protein [Methanonatronarchaeum sp. AMET-Sl]